MKIEWEDQPNERDHKRQELVENAAQLFREKGFKETKLDEIAAGSQKGKTALYYYFKNKKSLFAAVVEWEISRIYQDIENYTLLCEGNATRLEDWQPQTDFDCHVALQRYVEKTVEIGDKLLHRQKRIFKEYTLFEKLIQSAILVFKEQNVALLQKVLQYGQSQKQINMSDRELELATYAIFRICFTYYSDIMQGIDFGVGCDELQQIVQILLREKWTP